MNTLSFNGRIPVPRNVLPIFTIANERLSYAVFANPASSSILFLLLYVVTRFC